MSRTFDSLVVASHNTDKIAEIERLLEAAATGISVVRRLEWPEIDETEDTLEGNALLKARVVAEVTGVAALADDTGLEVDALGGAPGVRTARFAGERATYEDNVAKLLDVLQGEVNRIARFRTAIAVVDPKGWERVVVGELVGSISTGRRGVNGFGYDPVFEVEGRTLAEMTVEEKNAISHRGRGLRAMIETLGETDRSAG